MTTVMVKKTTIMATMTMNASTTKKMMFTMVINGKYSNDNDESDNECVEDDKDDIYDEEDDVYDGNSW